MARVAKLVGDEVAKVELAPGVGYVLSKIEGTDGIRVTPEAFGKIRNAEAFTIPTIVVEALKKVK